MNLAKQRMELWLDYYANGPSVDTIFYILGCAVYEVYASCVLTIGFRN